MRKQLEDIRAFHEKFELGYDGPVRSLPEDLTDFRIKFMAEELDEYQTMSGWAARKKKWLSIGLSAGVEAEDIAEYTEALEGVLDAFVDQMYVILGTVYLHGMSNILEEAWDRVHAKNMEKVRKARSNGEVTDSGRAPTFDVVKPLGWTPPSHKDLVSGHDLAGGGKK